MYVRIYVRVCMCMYLCFSDSLLHPIVPGVPYSVVVIAETGGGAGEESERTLFYSKELSMLTGFILCVPCMYVCIECHSNGTYVMLLLSLYGMV